MGFPAHYSPEIGVVRFGCATPASAKMGFKERAARRSWFFGLLYRPIGLFPQKWGTASLSGLVPADRKVLGRRSRPAMPASANHGAFEIMPLLRENANFRGSRFWNCRRFVKNQKTPSSQPESSRISWAQSSHFSSR